MDKPVKDHVEKLDPQRTQKLVSAVIEGSYDGIYVTDGKAKTLIVNKSYERISGLDRKQLIGKSMHELVKNNVINASGTLMALESRKPVTMEQVFKTGKRAFITSTPLVSRHGEIVMVITNVRDITELHELKSRLERTESEYEKNSFEIEALRRELSRGDMVVRDGAMVSVLRMAGRVSKLDTPVLLTGETGVGKDMVASYIFRDSNRVDARFIKVNCGAIPGRMLEAELFGYAGPDGKMGMVEVANGGTIFLDEVGELPPDLQTRLLVLLQYGEIRRIGADAPTKVDVRVIASSSHDLEQLVAEKKLREDLFYRISVFPIHIPPLRERKADILPLAQHFVDMLNGKYDTHVRLSKDTHELLLSYGWPGNVRELENVIERALIMSASGEITQDEFAPLLKEEETQPGGSLDINLKAVVQRLELDYITQAYRKYGNVRDAARSLGMDAATFVRKRKKYSGGQ